MINKKVSSLIGLAILVCGTILGIFILSQSQNINLRATDDIRPVNVKITNVDAESFDISWTTDTNTIGYVKWGTNQANLDKVSPDSITNEGTVHYIAVDGLKPRTKYYFTLYSNGRAFSNEGRPYIVATGTNLDLPPNAHFMGGKVVGQNGEPIKNAIVYVSIADNPALSSTTSIDGNWVIPLSNMRTPDFTSYLPISDDSIVQVLVDAGSAGQSIGITYPSKSEPLQAMSLGTNYDFRTTPENQTPFSPETDIVIE